MILAIETSCDDTCAAVVTARRADPLQRRLLPARARPLRRRGAGDRLAPPPRARQRRRRRRARTAGASLDDVDLLALTQGPGLVGALLVGVATGKALAAARRLPVAPVDHLQGHVAANFLHTDDPPVRAALPVPDRLGRPHAAHARRRPRGFTPRAHARRRGGGGVRQGRPAARPRLPGGPALSKLAARATGPRSTSRRARASPAWTSRSPASRPPCSTRSATSGGGDGARAPPTLPPPTSTRSWRR